MLTLRYAFAVGFIVLAGADLSMAIDSSPEGLLKEQYHLTRVGRCFVAASEAGFLQEYQTRVGPRIQYMAQAFDKYASAIQIDIALEQVEDYRIQVNSELGDVDLALPRMPQRNAYERQQLQALRLYRQSVAKELDVTNTQVAALKRRVVPIGQKEKYLKDFEEKRSDFLESARDVRKTCDACLAEYRKLKDDPAVSNLLKAYQRFNKAFIPLGPSPAMQKAVITIKEAERAYSPETAVARAKKKKKTLKSRFPSTKK